MNKTSKFFLQICCCGVLSVSVFAETSSVPQQEEALQDGAEVKAANIRMWFLAPTDRTDVEFGVAPTFQKKMRIVISAGAAQEGVVLLFDPYAFQTTGYREISPSNYHLKLMEESSLGKWTVLKEIPAHLDEAKYYTVFVLRKAGNDWELGLLDDFKESGIPSNEQKEKMANLPSKQTLLVFNQLPGCRLVMSSREEQFNETVETDQKKLFEGFPAKIVNMEIQMITEKGTSNFEVELDFSSPNTSYSVCPALDIYNRPGTKILRNCSQE